MKVNNSEKEKANFAQSKTLLRYLAESFLQMQVHWFECQNVKAGLKLCRVGSTTALRFFNVDLKIGSILPG